MWTILWPLRIPREPLFTNPGNLRVCLLYGVIFLLLSSNLDVLPWLLSWMCSEHLYSWICLSCPWTLYPLLSGCRKKAVSGDLLCLWDCQLDSGCLYCDLLHIGPGSVATQSTPAYGWWPSNPLLAPLEDQESFRCFLGLQILLFLFAGFTEAPF